MYRELLPSRGDLFFDSNTCSKERTCADALVLFKTS